jgi:hypothetical protein
VVYAAAVQPFRDVRRAFWLASLAFLPLFIWWLGWFPAFMSSDSINQLGQVETGEFTNEHPAFHTITLWLITRFWDNAGAISLVQIALLALLLGLVARRLVALGVPLWLAVGAAWVTGLAPAVGPTSITIWKDVAFALAFLWVFAELLLLVRMGAAFWLEVGNPVRLGGALSLLWLFRHNGPLTVVLVLGVLAWTNRDSLRRVGVTGLVLVGVVLVVQGPLYWMFSVDRARPAGVEVLLPAVASSYVHEPGNFDPAELELLSAIAPLEVWRTYYDCDEANPLLFAPGMNVEVIRRDPEPFLRLAIRTVVRDLDTTLGMFWCRASFLFLPRQPENAYLQRPPFRISPNELGLERAPLWTFAYERTLDVFAAVEPRGRLWLTWRPALVIWLTIATYAALVARGARVLLVPGALFGAHLVNVAATSLNQEFRLAFPLYLAGLLSLPLLWFVRYPDRLVAASYRRTGRSLTTTSVPSGPGRGRPSASNSRPTRSDQP